MEAKSQRLYKTSNQNWGEVILNYLGKSCYYCDKKDKLHIHHILPLSRGGRNELSNLEVVCTLCHRKLHDQWKKIAPLKVSREKNCTKCGRLVIRKLNKAIIICDWCKKTEKVIFNRRYQKSYVLQSKLAQLECAT